ncbi:MAG: 3 beta-hydroxysteroid dehydrogenase/Delta 5--_4-isomerase [Verrucomicrobiae bacterium]|nr:3 beta-hydroxysteroid dehydrogenase/Delta 5-->4-isomerase [Verrucomicrobiae bacterium]
MGGILMTGIGLVGAQIVKQLKQEHGIRPVVLDLHFQWPYLDTILDRGDFIAVEGSILDQQLVADTLRQHDIERIVHTAAVLPLRVGHAAHPGFYQVNSWGTANLMFQARQAGVRKFVMFSTNGVYQFRQHPVTAPVAEDFPSGLSRHNSYGNSKAVAEFLLRELVEDGAFHANILRPGEIYGPVMVRPGDDPIYWLAMLNAAIAGQSYVLENHPEHRLDWVYCKDVAALAVRLLLADATPHIEYHAASGRCMGIYDFKAELDRQFSGNRVELRNCKHGGWNHPLSMNRAKTDLDFAPRYDLARGIADFVEWFRHRK